MAQSDGPSFLVKAGVLAGGVAALGVFAFWPMCQAMQGEPTVNITFKGVILGAMVTMVGLNLVLLGDKGIPWKKTGDQPLTAFQKAAIGVTVGAALALTGLVWFFFNQYGYSMRF